MVKKLFWVGRILLGRQAIANKQNLIFGPIVHYISIGTQDWLSERKLWESPDPLALSGLPASFSIPAGHIGVLLQKHVY